jgi:hypothetical protein
VTSNDTVLTSWSRALQARNTSDYRPLDKLDSLSRIETIAWFEALDRSANTDLAWDKLSDVQKKVPDLVRIANTGSYSVGTGHELAALSLPLEFDELAAIYKLSRQKNLSRDELVPALNAMPDQCFSKVDPTKVNVIGWGLWAGFFQQQLCHAIQRNFDFLQHKWGVHDEAAAFSAKCNQMLGGLRSYPFVRRFNCTNAASYHSSVDDGFKVTMAAPQLVPAECWNFLCYEFEHEVYRPNPNPHVNEWHKHNPPPGTVYDILPRLNHPSLVERPDTPALLDKLHKLAPYNPALAYYILDKRYGRNPTYEQATNVLGPIMAYSEHAMETIADTVKDQPEKYEQLLSKTAEINPSDYFKLGEYFEDRDPDKAASYMEKGNTNDLDSVRAAAYSRWLVHYYLQKGLTNAARQEADFAGEVYSFTGLEAKAEFLEDTGDDAGAFQWYANIEERYDDAGPLIGFCLRYKSKTGDTRYDREVQKRMSKLFPKGMEKVGLRNFQSAPADGVLINGVSDLTRAAGLKRGDVIVAVSGIRAHNVRQYEYVRDSKSDPDLDLVVWQAGTYHEIHASPPNHLFDVDIVDYPSK